jgi:hypothetical protein
MSSTTSALFRAGCARPVPEPAGAALHGSLVKLVLARHVGADQTLQRIIAKPVQVKGQPACRWSTATRPATSPATCRWTRRRRWLPSCCRRAFATLTCSTADGEVQLTFSKKGKPMLQRHGAQAPREAAAGGHDREKKRYLELSRPFLRDLGVTDAQGALIPSMSRKWKQINKFIEVFDHALANAPVRRSRPAGGRLRFGQGLPDLRHARLPAQHPGREAQVTGVELRQDMVDLCNAAAARLEHRGWSSSAATCAAWCLRPSR